MYKLKFVDPNGDVPNSLPDILPTFGVGVKDPSIIALLTYPGIEKIGDISTVTDRALDTILPPDETVLVVIDHCDFDIIMSVSVLQLRGEGVDVSVYIDTIVEAADQQGLIEYVHSNSNDVFEKVKAMRYFIIFGFLPNNIKM